MEHAKKRLILVDPADMHNHSPSLYRPTPVDRKLSSFDDEVSSILRSDLPDDEKAKLYMIALRGYRHFHAAPVEQTDPLKEILTSVKPELQIKAKRILKQIKPHVRWSEDGELVSGNELASDSNLSELLNEATTKNGADDVIGLSEFAETLKRSDTPSHFIPNERLRRHLRALKRGRNPSTPRRSGKKKSRKTLEWEAIE